MAKINDSITRRIGPQDDEFTPSFDLSPASLKDIEMYKDDNGNYDINDYICNNLEKHCNGCEYIKTCIAGKYSKEK